MLARFAIPIAILAVLFLPLPFVICFFVFGALLAISSRGDPGYAPAVIARAAGPALLRGPPR
jgi:hypothetical protein